MSRRVSSKVAQNSQEKFNADSHDLARLGYAQELMRNMGGFSNFAMSFSIISILTGATQLYGYGLQHGGPLQMSLGWGLVSFFTLMVALAMAELASAYPTSGALYHWSSFLGGRTLGWVTACLNTVGQFAILAGIDYGLAQFLVGLLEWQGSPWVLNSVYLAILLSHALINHMGINLVASLNRFSAWYHMGVVALLFAVLFSKGFSQSIEFMGTFSKTDSYSPSYSFLVGLLLAQWTLTGFDASAHITEETVNPRKNAPWGIFMAVVVSVVFGWIMLFAVTLSIPDLAGVSGAGDRAFGEILKLRLGTGWGLFLLSLVGGAMWLCGLSCLTSASRMIYAFARDGGLPASKFWAEVSSKYRTPAHAIWGLCLLALILVFSVDLYSAVVSIATIALYISYGLPIYARLVGRIQGRLEEQGPWNLGRWSTPVSWVALIWIGMISTLFVLPPNHQAGYVMAGCFLLLGVIWWGYARKQFKGPVYSANLNSAASLSEEVQVDLHLPIETFPERSFERPV